jgi:predicted permease
LTVRKYFYRPIWRTALWVFRVLAGNAAKSAVPTAKTEFLLAKQYHQSEELVADTISFTTAVAVVTLIVWLLLLSWIYPGAFSLK